MTPGLVQHRTREQNPHLSSHSLIYMWDFFWQLIICYSHFFYPNAGKFYGSRENKSVVK